MRYPVSIAAEFCQEPSILNPRGSYVQDLLFSCSHGIYAHSPVEGQGCSRWNSRVTSRDRYSLAESGAAQASATASAIIRLALVIVA